MIRVWPVWGCEYECTVDRGLWGVGKSCTCYGVLPTRLDTICPDGTECDICNIDKVEILASYYQPGKELNLILIQIPDNHCSAK
jgi:hypothetical protein